MLDLNELSKTCEQISHQRYENGAKIDADVLKACSGEVVEAVIARSRMFYNDNDESYKSEYASELADIIYCVLVASALDGVDIENALRECINKNYERSLKVGDKL